MLNLGSKVSLRSTKSIVNIDSSGSTHRTDTYGQLALTGKSILSGALDAATYKEILAVTGSGCLRFCGLRAADTTSRTLGLKVVIDGTTVFDAVSDAVTAITSPIIAVGTLSDYGVLLGETIFNSSLSVSVKSSIGETNKLSMSYLYETW